MEIKKILAGQDPFPCRSDCLYKEKSLLPCHWIACPGAGGAEGRIMSFELRFQLAANDRFRIHVSADQQYQLFIDGVFAGRGCDMKSPENWYFESYDVALEPGEHVFSALVWNYEKFSPMNRMTLGPGFILVPEAPYTSQFGTGIAEWKTRQIKNYSFVPPKITPGAWMSVAPHETCDLNAPGPGEWLKPLRLEQGVNGSLFQASDCRCLKPSVIKDFEPGAKITPKAVLILDSHDSNSPLPGQVKEQKALDAFNSSLNTEKITIPPRSAKKIIFDLENYYCAFTTLSAAGGRGAKITVTWAEAAFTDSEKPVKGRRDTLAGKYFRGVWDQLILDGEDYRWSPLSWRCGRFIELCITTAAEALELDEFSLVETRYPLEMDIEFACDDEKINQIIPFCFRTLQMSAHDNFMDCPFYEQLLYAGDGRLEAAVSLVACKDDTLVKKAISILASSRDINGFTMARWPSTCRQYIPSFSLWWVGMLYDYARWRSDRDFVISHMPAMRNLLDSFIMRLDSRGFLTGRPWEWNFIDWVDEWRNEYSGGTPWGIDGSVNASYNWLFVYILGLAEELECYAGNEHLAAYWRTTAGELSEKLKKRLWLEQKGLFSEDGSVDHFSQHAQILAILSGKLEDKYIEKLRHSLFAEEKLVKCSIFYKHYLFEALKILQLGDKIISEFGLWNTFIDKGFKTAPETPENRTFNQRSDCHGWGAHPIYHLVKNIGGVKPAEMGFGSVLIEPEPGKLKKLRAQCVHPRGIIALDLEKKADKLNVKATLPPGIAGSFVYRQKTVELKKTENHFEIQG